MITVERLGDRQPAASIPRKRKPTRMGGRLNKALPATGRKPVWPSEPQQRPIVIKIHKIRCMVCGQLMVCGRGVLMKRIDPSGESARKTTRDQSQEDSPHTDPLA